MPTQLYRHFDASGALLYVGVSANVLGRLKQHQGRATWFDRIATIAVEHFATRTEALMAERQAILNEHPLHNLHQVPRQGVALNGRVAAAIDHAGGAKRPRQIVREAPGARSPPAASRPRDGRDRRIGRGGDRGAGQPSRSAARSVRRGGRLMPTEADIDPPTEKEEAA